jgi:peptide methionine sulfoxide reductase msrA/msrB
MNKSSSLTPLQNDVIFHLATESPYVGEYTNTDIDGTYLCRNCGIALFRATSKFQSTCGWPSFDDAIKNAVTQKPDADGERIEISCTRCNAHLGHIFHGEKYTERNTRYCVNSASLDFVTNTTIIDTDEIILAAGCFWGVEYHLKKLNGVLLTQVGYCGGEMEYPSYPDVCTGTTGRLEVVRVIFDDTKLSLEDLLRKFFDIHDPTQANGQGPDIGSQYLSCVFCYNQQQKDTVTKVINSLQKVPNAPQIKTLIRDMPTFWIAEEYHQDYLNKKCIEPHCNI